MKGRYSARLFEESYDVRNRVQCTAGALFVNCRRVGSKYRKVRTVVHLMQIFVIKILCRLFRIRKFSEILF